MINKLLNAITEGLNLRCLVDEQPEEKLEGDLTLKVTMFSTKDVSDEVKELFKQEFYNHLLEKFRESEEGEFITYSFNDGMKKYIGTVQQQANDNMAEVLLKLPSLEKGESYQFPDDTYVTFALIEKSDQKMYAEVAKASAWIQEKYKKQ